ncbi:MAG: surface protein [Isosphaeraceae bacterium]|jgi:hypothetical protein|nr:MAG: surface protein [Isosphaeraceae bacterium]
MWLWFLAAGLTGFHPPADSPPASPDHSPATVSFRRDVAPILARAGCNTGPCHGNAAGKGGFRLSLRGEDPAADWFAITRDALGRRINPTQPDRSLLLLKPTGRVPHEGGLRITPNSPEEHTLRAWIAAGTPDDGPSLPPLARLLINPSELLVEPDPNGRYNTPLTVTAQFADGSSRDVTHLTAFDLNDPTLASVDPSGRVTASRPGEVAIAARYMNGRATARLAFLPPPPDSPWTPPPPANLIDEIVFRRWQTLRIHPAPACDDLTWLRRATLDAIGRLPTPNEIRSFLADSSPDRRARWVDALLERPEFADFWALKWADLLRNEEKTMGAKGAWIFQRWLRDQIAAKLPLDQFAFRLIASTGSTWRNPPASFHRTNRNPPAAAETFAQVFLGIRLQCARCHNHPFDSWTQDDYYSLAAAFANLSRKQIDNRRRDSFDTHEINGDEIIFLSPTQPTLRHPRTGAPLTPRGLGGPPLTLDPADTNALDNLADWLTHNRQFARSLANRIWFHLMGRGLVEPVDDFRDSNPPSHPELLEALTDQLIAHRFQLRPLVRLILTSETYRRDTDPTAPADDPSFAQARVKLLPAEVLRDAISQVLDVPDSFRDAPRPTRATQLPGVRHRDDFLKAFGKPDRLLTCECERAESVTLAQAFQLINGSAIRSKLEADNNRISRLLASDLSDQAILDELYLAALTRFPTDAERAGLLEHLRTSPHRRQAWEDITWALINSKEFLLRH